MQEITFLHQNASKWKRFETLMADQQADPDTLVELFIELTDDLSYARTFYPDSKTTQYLNGLTMHVHQKIYKNKKEEKSRVVTYWKEELPGLFYMYRNPLLYAAIIFVVSVSIGALSAANDVGFVRLILGVMAAKTTVIRLIGHNLDDTIFTPIEAGYEPVFPQVSKLTGQDVSTIKEVLNVSIDRKTYSKETQQELLDKTKSSIQNRLDVQSDLPPQDFLSTVLKDYNAVKWKRSTIGSGSFRHL